MSIQPSSRLAQFVALVALTTAVPTRAQNGYSFLDASSSRVGYADASYFASADCEALVSRTTDDYSILSARLVAPDDDVPEHCRVSGVIPAEIRFELNFPSAWNGRFYMHGNGGFAGTPPESQGRQLSRDRALRHAFATAYTDTGHDSRSEPLATFAHGNLQKTIDYAFRAVHLTVLSAKELIDVYYGRGPRYSYWDGCSTGGRQGLISAQRFPEDFDGIVAGAPVLDFTNTMISYAWNGRALESSTLDLEKIELVAKFVTAKCDGVDGLEDGLIDDPRACAFDPATELPRCSGSESGPTCFSEDDVEALRLIYGGVRRGAGQFYPGQPFGAESVGLTRRGSSSGWGGWILSSRGPSIQELFAKSFFRYMAFPGDDPEYDWNTFDFEKDPERMGAIREILDAVDPDLTRFKERGGKLISYFGWADTALNPLRTVAYYEEVGDAMGARPHDFFRLFMVPGMFHCAGGLGVDRFDALTALVDWVEAGVAPDTFLAVREENGTVTLSRPLCPYPKVARYDGASSAHDAASFSCIAPIGASN